MAYKLPINPRFIPLPELLVRCLTCGHIEDFNKMKTAPAKRSFATDGRVVCSKCGAKGNCIEVKALNKDVKLEEK